MKQVKVYQMWVPRFLEQTQIPAYSREVKFEVIGVVVGETITPDIVWHLTNHSCWNGENKEICDRGCTYIPNQYDKGYTNDDICFELDGVWCCAKSAGWHFCNSLKEAKLYLRSNSNAINLHLTR